MEFESKLSCEQVRHRLLSLTEPIAFQWTPRDVFLSKWKRKDTFHLLKISEYGSPSMPPTHPFIGKVKPSAEGCVISGGFSLTMLPKLILACFLGPVWAFIIFIFFPRNFNILGILLILPLPLALTGFVYFLIGRLPNYFQKNNHAAVIKFINENLLK